jgi:hypothetical protein
MTSMGPVILFGGDAKNLPEVSKPKLIAARYLFAPSSGVWGIPGRSLKIGTITLPDDSEIRFSTEVGVCDEKILF